jgi:hypothetical protein
MQAAGLFYPDRLIFHAELIVLIPILIILYAELFDNIGKVQGGCR